MYYLVVVFSVLLAAFAQMLLKKSATISYDSIIKEYVNPWVVCGYGMMGASLLINIFAMSKGVMVKELGTIEALSYLFIPLLSWLFFKEKISARKALSIVLILVGIFIFFS